MSLLLRPILPLRWNAATWLILPVAVLMVMAAHGNTVDGNRAPLWDGLVALSASGFIVTLPVLAAAAAWEGARMSRAAVDRFPSNRTRVRVLWGRVWPFFLCSFLGHSVALVSVIDHSGLPVSGYPNPLLIVGFLSMVTVTIGCGVALGTVIHPTLSIPLAALALYQWMARPLFDGNNVSWRHITGDSLWSVGDSPYYVVDVRAIIAPTLVAVAVAVVACLALALHFRPLKFLVGSVIVGTSIFCAVLVCAGVSANPTSPRPDSALVCSGKTPQVCLWPEQIAENSSTENTLRQAYARAASIIRLPDSVTVGGNANETLNLRFPLRAGAIQLQFALGTAIGNWVSCGVEPADNTSYRARLEVLLAARLVTGVPPGAALPEAVGNSGEASQVATAAVASPLPFSTPEQAIPKLQQAITIRTCR